MQGCVQPDWGYFEWTEQIISINPYQLIQTVFVIILKDIHTLDTLLIKIQFVRK